MVAGRFGISMISELRKINGDLADFLYTQSTVPLLLVDPQQCITDCNAAFLKLFSLAEKPLGAPLADFLTTESGGALFEAGHQEFVCNLKSGVRGVLTAQRLPVAGGLLLWCERLLQSNNQVVEQMSFLNNEFIAMQRELDKKNYHLNRVQLELKEKVIKLQAKNAEFEQFVYSVSHDLRSPLVTVKTFLGYLEKDLAEVNRERLAQDIQYIHSAADKMKLLLDELLEFSRIGRVESSPVQVSLKELLEMVLGQLAGVIRERSVEIHLPDTELILFGDLPRLHQIWQNLIENAIKYSRDDVSPRIETGWQQMNAETVFFVQDNGIGIDQRHLGTVFGVFEKLDPRSPGAGLGLSIVQRIVEMYGGRIWVESDGDGQGSCFRFTLPGALKGLP
jgi:signal transduction histidine kinase